MHNYTFICFIFSGNVCTLLEMDFCLGVNKVLVLVLVLVLSELRYLFVRISGNGYLLNLRTSYLLHL